MCGWSPRGCTADASYCLFGLVSAIDRYDPEEGTRFETYAILRIRGAILDGIRETDWVPRSVRSRARWLARTTEELSQQLERTPTPQELAEALGWAVGDVYEVGQEVDEGAIAHLRSNAAGDDEPTLVPLPVDPAAEDPMLAYQVEMTRCRLAEGLVSLPDRERLVATLYYREQLTMGEIGEVLGVTESRVCQIYTQAVLSLREAVASSVSA